MAIISLFLSLAVLIGFFMIVSRLGKIEAHAKSSAEGIGRLIHIQEELHELTLQQAKLIQVISNKNDK